jgi:hypothetical protein
MFIICGHALHGDDHIAIITLKTRFHIHDSLHSPAL